MGLGRQGSDVPCANSERGRVRKKSRHRACPGGSSAGALRNAREFHVAHQRGNHPGKRGGVLSDTSKMPLAENLGQRLTCHWRIRDQEIPWPVASQQSLPPLPRARVLQQMVASPCKHLTSERCLRKSTPGTGHPKKSRMNQNVEPRNKSPRNGFVSVCLLL